MGSLPRLATIADLDLLRTQSALQAAAVVPVNANPSDAVVIPDGYTLVVVRKYAPQGYVTLGADAFLRIL